MILETRQAGVLLHPTSLPGPYGIGDLGGEAVRFLDWMKEAGLALWQVLPLGPTGFADSPYQCFSAFAGNPFLISPELLIEEGLLDRGDARHQHFPGDRVDFGQVFEWKWRVLRRAFQTFREGSFPALRKRLDAFVKSPSSHVWLDDYVLFIALKEAQGGQVWNNWPAALRTRKPETLVQARADLKAEIEFHTFVQFLFFDQWKRLREAAHARGVSIIGDMPIYVAYDSADTWAHQDLFKLRPNGEPTHVAGVPPDYFSETGQLWGNPLYRWDKMHEQGYAWWIARMKAMLELVDVIRLDHFRGFEGYWQVKFGEPTAVDGKWMPGPRAALFDALRGTLDELPIIAENLGVITPEVEALREQFGLPGMKVLQFGWGAASTEPPVPDPDNVFQPHKIERGSVVYTGTHDNPTTMQWWKEFASTAEKRLMRVYLGTSGRSPHLDLMRAAFASPANTVLVPMQDVLGIGGEGRMNFPGKEAGNWTWRMRKGRTTKALARKVRRNLLLFERCAGQIEIARQLAERQPAAEKARKP